MRELSTGQKREKRNVGIALAGTDAFAQHRGTSAVTPCVNNDLQGSQRAIQSSGKCTPQRRLPSESWLRLPIQEASKWNRSWQQSCCFNGREVFSRKTVTAFDGGGDMRNKKRDPKRWVILALVNVLVILYPVSLYCQAGDDRSTLVGACALVGAAVLLAIGDLLTIALAFAE